MGLFDKFVSAEVKQRSNTIKINPYELPDVAAQTIAKICSIKKNEDEESGELVNFFTSNDNQFINFILENRGSFANIDLWQDLIERIEAIGLELESHENTAATQVVVAGGFSAGKSSFLNTISEAGDLLPTGINPVSMISTYLYFSSNTKDIRVSGINQLKAPVQLNLDILQSIKHADDKNNSGKKTATLASVLSKLLVELPAVNATIDGLCFIDTPGYNNDMSKNVDNGIADKDMATESFKDGNVLFWIVDAEAGVVNMKDEEMIQNFVDGHDGDCKIVIIFNKADKKRSDIANIVDSAYSALQKKLYAKDIIDILGFTCTEKKILYSKNGYNSINDLLAKVKTAGNGYSTINRLKGEIQDMFSNEIKNQEEGIKYFNGKLKETNQTKTSNRSAIQGTKDENKNILDALWTVLVTDYDKYVESTKKTFEYCNNFRGGWVDFFNEVNNWDTNEHECFDNTLVPILNRCRNAFNNLDNRYQNWEPENYYLEEYRRKIYNAVKGQFESLEEEASTYLERNDSSIKSFNDSISQCQSLLSQFNYFFPCVMKALDKDIERCFKVKNKTVLPNASYEIPSNLDVFYAINNDDFDSFRLSFATKDGVDLSDSNAEGYSPFTYAVRMGNTEMVKFFLNHMADASALDKRGLNAFHTAAQNHNMTICKMLLNEDSSLKDSLTKNGKTATQVAAESTFTI